MEEKLTPGQLDEKIAKLEEESRRIQKALAPLRADKLAQTILKTKRDGSYPPRENRTVLRVSRGLTVHGTRLTLYFIRDHMKAGNSLKNIRDIFELTDEEMLDILDYFHLNKEEFEKEYREVVKAGEDERRYWEDANRGLMEKTHEQREAVIARLREWSEQYQSKGKNEDIARS